MNKRKILKTLLFSVAIGLVLASPFIFLSELRRNLERNVENFQNEIVNYKAEITRATTYFRQYKESILSSDETAVYKIKIVDAYNKGIYQTLSGFNTGFLEETIYTDGPTFALFAFSGGEGGTTVYVGHFEPTSGDSVEKATRDATRNDGLLSAMSILSDMRRLPLDQVPLRDYKKVEDAKSKNDMRLKVTYHKVASRVEAISLEAHLNKDWVSDAWKYHVSQKNKS